MLPPVAISFEVEPQLEYVVLKLTSEAALVGVLPFPVDNLEGNVLQRVRGDYLKKQLMREAERDRGGGKVETERQREREERQRRVRVIIAKYISLNDNTINVSKITLNCDLMLIISGVISMLNAKAET